jgi:hypothetical protein
MRASPGAGPLTSQPTMAGATACVAPPTGAASASCRPRCGFSVGVSTSGPCAARALDAFLHRHQHDNRFAAFQLATPRCGPPIQVSSISTSPCRGISTSPCRGSRPAFTMVRRSLCRVSHAVSCRRMRAGVRRANVRAEPRAGGGARATRGAARFFVFFFQAPARLIQHGSEDQSHGPTSHSDRALQPDSCGLDVFHGSP